MDEQRHRKIIEEFLYALNKESNAFILKGGTALMLRYGLNRFSEDIDLDASHRKANSFIDTFCKMHKIPYRTAKDTPTVSRFMLNYNQEGTQLKVEISYRNKNIHPGDHQCMDGIEVYTIDRLCQLKASAYQGRDTLRDLYDLSFICDRYFSDLSAGTKNQISDALTYKGFDHFDYITSTQSDPLINKEKLAELYLKMFDKLDLLYTKEEVQQVTQKKEHKRSITMQKNSNRGHSR